MFSRRSHHLNSSRRRDRASRALATSLNGECSAYFVALKVRRLFGAQRTRHRQKRRSNTRAVRDEGRPNGERDIGDSMTSPVLPNTKIGQSQQKRRPHLGASLDEPVRLCCRSPSAMARGGIVASKQHMCAGWAGGRCGEAASSISTEPSQASARKVPSPSCGQREPEAWFQ